jgi:hypothetical protein
MKNHHNGDDTEYIFTLAVPMEHELKVTEPPVCEKTNLQTPIVIKLFPKWQCNISASAQCYNNNNNSIQFNSLLLMCRVNSKRQLQKQHSVYTT